MKWEFNDDTPIYLQIIEHFKTEIACGNMKAGDKVLPVRELAIQAGVNPNTMQKALSELEREGLLESQRTAGRFVTNKLDNSEGLKNNLANNLMQEFMKNMQKIGYTPLQSLEEYEAFVMKADKKNNNV